MKSLVLKDLFNIGHNAKSASYYAGSCIDRPDCIYSSLLLTASGVGMVLCDVSNQLSHFCKARALISIGRYLYGKQKI